MAQGKSKKETAELLSVGLRTIFNWLADDNYRDYVKRVEAEYVSEMRARFFALTEKAIVTYDKILDGYAVEPGPAVRVATNILKSRGIIRDHIEEEADDMEIKVAWDAAVTATVSAERE